MAMDTVKRTVEYARSIEKEHDKCFRFTITTNGVLLDDENIEYITGRCPTRCSPWMAARR